MSIVEELPETITKECPFKELETSFSKTLFVTKSDDGKYGCYKFENTNGLIAFEQLINAQKFISDFATTYQDSLSIQEVEFDEAVEIAKGRPDPVNSIIVGDNLQNPKIFYVK